jgi:hypothetical protein
MGLGLLAVKIDEDEPGGRHAKRKVLLPELRAEIAGDRLLFSRQMPVRAALPVACDLVLIARLTLRPGNGGVGP